MGSLWWMQPGWRDTTCSWCGNTIWPEGDPDWGLCLPCMNMQAARKQMEEQMRHEYNQMMAKEYYALNQCQRCGSMDDKRIQCAPLYTDVYAQECERKHTMHPHYSDNGWITQWAWGPASQCDGRQYP